MNSMLRTAMDSILENSVFRCDVQMIERYLKIAKNLEKHGGEFSLTVGQL